MTRSSLPSWDLELVDERPPRGTIEALGLMWMLRRRAGDVFILEG